MSKPRPPLDLAAGAAFSKLADEIAALTGGGDSSGPADLAAMLLPAGEPVADETVLAEVRAALGCGASE